MTSNDDYLSDPELHREPTARQRLGELIRLMPYQTDPDDSVCAERIARLQETVRKEEEDEEARERNRGRLESVPSIHSESSARSGITICTDDIPPNFHPAGTTWSHPVPIAGEEWDRWLVRGIPHVERCIEISRLVLINDFHLWIGGYPAGFCIS